MNGQTWSLRRIADLLEEVERALQGKQKRPVLDIRHDLEEACKYLHRFAAEWHRPRDD